MSNFPGTGRSTNSIAWKRWLLWNKWMPYGKLPWRSYKLSLLYENESCDEHAVYFWRWLKWRAMLITFLLSSNDLYLYKRIFWRKYSLNILNLLNILKNTRPSLKREVKPFSEEILLRVELIASLSVIESPRKRDLSYQERSCCKLIQGTYYITTKGLVTNMVVSRVINGNDRLRKGNRLRRGWRLKYLLPLQNAWAMPWVYVRNRY